MKNFRSLLNLRAAVLASFFNQGLTFSCIASRIPDFKENIGLNDAELGSVLLGMPLGQLITMGISGYLIGRFTSKKVLLLGAVAYPFVLIFAAFCSTYHTLAVILFLSGMAANTINISMNTQAAGAERYYQKSMMSGFHAVWSVACIVGGIIGVLFINLGLSIKFHYIFMFLLNCSIIFSVWKYLLDSDEKKENRPARNTKSGIPFFLIFCGIVGFCCMYSESILYNWSVMYFKEVLLLPEQYIHIGYIAGMSAMVVSRFSADWFINKYKQIKVMIFCGSCIFTGIMLCVFFPYMATSILGMMLLGMGTSAVIPMVYSFAGKYDSQNLGKSMTIVISISFLGFMSGPGITGFISEMTNLRISFIPVLFIGLFIIFSAFIFKKNAPSAYSGFDGK